MQQMTFLERQKMGILARNVLMFQILFCDFKTQILLIFQKDTYQILILLTYLKYTICNVKKLNL